MMQKRWIFIVILSIVYDETTTATTESKEKQIKELENIKNELYIKINDAINDSVITLEKNNDTDSFLAVGSMIELKKQIDQLNATFEADAKLEDLSKAVSKVEDDSSDEDISGNNVTQHKISMDAFSQSKRGNPNNLRRASAVRVSKVPEIRINLDQLLKILQGDDFKKEIKIEKPHYLAIKKKAEEWILERQREKAKIKAYKAQILRFKYEKCPSFGAETKNKKKKLTRRKSKKKKKNKNKNKTYPCCRKCCKRSYMGCL